MTDDRQTESPNVEVPQPYGKINKIKRNKEKYF
jgi:hypothetical protein